MQTETLQTLFQ